MEEEMVTHSSVLAWRIPWTEEPGGLQSMGPQRVGHDRVTNTRQWFYLCIITEINHSWSNLLHLLFLGRSFKHTMCLTDHVQLQECPPWALWGSLSSTIFTFLISIWILKVNFCRVALRCRAPFHCAAKWSATCGQASSLLWIPFPLRPPQSASRVPWAVRQALVSYLCCVYVDPNLLIHPNPHCSPLIHRIVLYICVSIPVWQIRPPMPFYWLPQFSSVQALSRVWLFATLWTAACQASQSITNSQSLLRPIASVAPPTISSPSPPTFNLSQHQGLLQRVSSLNQVAKVLEFQLHHQSFQWIFRTRFHMYVSMYNTCFSLSDLTSLWMMVPNSHPHCSKWASFVPFYEGVAFHSMHGPHLLYPFLCRRTLRLLPCPGSCKSLQCQSF